MATLASAPDTNLSRPELSALTSLRFFAAIWVVFFHIHEIGLWRGGSALYLAIIQLGYLGVSFFFVLSGFILVYVYSGRSTPKLRFWQARFARVYPAYAFSLLLTAPTLKLTAPYMRQFHVSPSLVYLSFPLLLEAWFPSVLFFWNVVGWSLSVEAFFYVVFPFALPILQRVTARPEGHTATRNLRLWIVVSFLLSLGLTLSYFFARPDHAAWPNSQDNFLPWLQIIKFNPLVRLPEFLLGMGVGLLFVRKRPRPSTRPLIAGLTLVAAGIILQRFIPYPVMHSGLLAPAFALLIYGFAAQPRWTRFLAAKPLILLGEASYSLYLLHAFVLGIMVYVFHLDRSPHIALVVALYLVFILLVSIGVYVGIENPLRKWLRPRRLPQPVPAIA